MLNNLICSYADEDLGCSGRSALLLLYFSITKKKSLKFRAAFTVFFVDDSLHKPHSVSVTRMPGDHHCLHLIASNNKIVRLHSLHS